PVAPLPPNSRKPCNSAFRRLNGVRCTDIPLHTCDRKSHCASPYFLSFQSVITGIQRAVPGRMKHLWAGLLLAGCQLFAGTQDSEFNVNTRYTVETILVAGDGWTTNLIADHDTHISSGLRKDLSALIGQKLNPAALDDLGKRLRTEFRAHTVERHIMRGK